MRTPEEIAQVIALNHHLKYGSLTEGSISDHIELAKIIQGAITSYAEEKVKEERERCAKVAESFKDFSVLKDKEGQELFGMRIANVIRNAK